jgi:hypothetical protein
MPNPKQTSPRVAKESSQALRDRGASPREKSIAGSAESQARGKNDGKKKGK